MRLIFWDNYSVSFFIPNTLLMIIYFNCGTAIHIDVYTICTGKNILLKTITLYHFIENIFYSDMTKLKILF